MENQRVTVKPWSKKKRVRVTATATLVILLVAFTLGTGAYALGKAFGFIETQSIKQAVFEKIEDDPELQASIEEAIQKEVCENRRLDIRVRYDKTFSPIQEMELCLGFERSENGLVRSLRFAVFEEAKETVVDRLITGLDQAISDNYGHPDGDGVVVTGSLAGVPVTYVIIGIEPQRTWTAEYAPLGGEYDQSFLAIISEARFKI